jgi:hypothetical protein
MLPGESSTAGEGLRDMSQRILHKIRNRLSPTYFYSQMNYWADRWDLDEATCPCDIHFNEWVADRELTNSTFYHFGSGNHHAIGIDQAQNGSGNRVFAITASIDEYRSYIKLVTRSPAIAKSYLLYFGDIYLTNPHLLPSFDAVTLFHLCEFSDQDADGYGGLADLDLLNLMTDKVRIGGCVLFYTGSFAYQKARGVIEQWKRMRKVEQREQFKSLVVYSRAQ